MDVINSTYETLKSYFLKNEIATKKSYELISSMPKEITKISCIHLGTSLDREYSRGENIYNQNIRKVHGSYYILTYGIIFPDTMNEEFIYAMRLLNELKVLEEAEVKFLNDEMLFSNHLVKMFSQKHLNAQTYLFARTLFVELKVYMESLQSPTEIKRVKEVDINTKMRKI